MKDKKKLLGEFKNEKINELFEIYKKDRFHARVVFMNSNREEYTEYFLWEFKTGKSIDLVFYRKRYGISKTNVIFSNEKVMYRVRIRTNGIWLCRGKNIRNLFFHDSDLSFIHNPSYIIIDEYLKVKFGWYRYIRDTFSRFEKSPTYVLNHKLTTKKKILCDFYGFDWQMTNKLHIADLGLYNTKFKNLQYYKEWLIDYNKFDHDFIEMNWRLFFDSLKMAKSLNRKVSLRWSAKRLHQEHQELAKEMTGIVYQYDTSVLENSKVFINFSKDFLIGKLLTTVKELAFEGIRLAHCVASYKDIVNKGRCGIFSLENDTLELCKNADGSIMIGQLRGWDNKPSSHSVHNEVQEYVDRFNDIHFPKMNVLTGDGIKLDGFEDKGEVLTEIPF